MFMDQPITPARVEVLIDVLRNCPEKTMNVTGLKRLLQPEGLPNRTEQSDQARQVISAAKQLGLVRESEGAVTLEWKSGDRRETRTVLLDALDTNVLLRDEVEPWFAKFFAFMIAREPGAAEAAPGQGDDWDVRFNTTVLQNATVANRFNASKYNGFRRWMRYMGLGWHDGKDVFQPNPFERLARVLPRIFDSDLVLTSDEFMTRLASRCPELDGGSVFCETNRDFEMSRRECTAALASALVELHDDGIIALECPIDNDGWSLRRATPARTKAMPSDRFDRIQFPAPRVAGKSK